MRACFPRQDENAHTLVLTMSGKLNLLFVRHGETQDNIDRILQGQRDTSLTDKGHREAEVMAEKFKGQNIDFLYHSDLTRMVQTIQPILKIHPNIPTASDSDLRGQALGSLEGKSYDVLNFSSPRSADSEAGVEQFDDFVRRLKRAMGRIVGAQAPKVGNEDRNVVIATHGVGITSIFKVLEDTPHCKGFNPALAVRGADAYEVRWTDSDDVSRLVVEQPADLPIKDGTLDFESVSGKPFVIELWGKKEKELDPEYYSGPAQKPKQ